MSSPSDPSNTVYSVFVSMKGSIYHQFFRIFLIKQVKVIFRCDYTVRYTKYSARANAIDVSAAKASTPELLQSAA